MSDELRRQIEKQLAEETEKQRRANLDKMMSGIIEKKGKKNKLVADANKAVGALILEENRVQPEKQVPDEKMAPWQKKKADQLKRLKDKKISQWQYDEWARGEEGERIVLPETHAIGEKREIWDPKVGE